MLKKYDLDTKIMIEDTGSEVLNYQLRNSQSTIFTQTTRKHLYKKYNFATALKLFYDDNDIRLFSDKKKPLQNVIQY